MEKTMKMTTTTMTKEMKRGAKKIVETSARGPRRGVYTKTAVMKYRLSNYFI